MKYVFGTDTSTFCLLVQKLDNALVKAEKLGNSLLQLANETDLIHGLTVRNAEAVNASADQITTVALYLHDLSESLTRNNEGLQLMEVLMMSLAAAVNNTTASMDQINQHISATHSWTSGTWALVTGLSTGSCLTIIVQAPISFHLKVIGTLSGKKCFL